MGSPTSTSTSAGTIVWFRNDLRLDDHPALVEAVERGGPVYPVYIHAPHEEGGWPPGAAWNWWRHSSLSTLADSLGKLGCPLIIRAAGSTLEELCRLVAETGASAVYWNRRYEPAIIARDSQIKQALREKSIEARSFNGALLYEPSEVKNKSGLPFQVFTPFWKSCLGQGEPAAPLATPKIRPSQGVIPSGTVEDLRLLPTIDWAENMRACWQPGEAGAHQDLATFLNRALKNYSEDRDRPDRIGTSRLSPRLAHGELSPRRIWQQTKQAIEEKGAGYAPGSEHFLREVGWREFAYHLLYHFPRTTDEPLRKEFAAFPWHLDTKALHRWKRGKTGYPIVDAGMRELWRTGWMHNRVRMIVGSFLVKDLLLPWQEGARWFWDTLVDADLASNTLGWQWTAGCGADAAPYFRVFNPVLQGEKFDPDGRYVGRYVPELNRLPTSHLHKPWEAGPLLLHEAGIALGEHYPMPMVDHGKARDAALEAFESIKRLKDSAGSNRA